MQTPPRQGILRKLQLAVLVCTGALTFLVGASPAAEPQKDPTTDSLGDPLPRGAARRFGTTRLSHKGTASCVAYSPNGKWLASGGYDGKAKLWDARTGAEVRQFSFPRWVRQVTWTPDSALLIAAGDADGIRCWDSSTGKLRYHFPEFDGSSVVHLAVSADGKILATGEAEFRSGSNPPKDVAYWNLETGKQIHRIKLPRANSISFSADGKLLAVGGNKTVRIVNVATGQEEPELNGDPQGIYGVAFSPDGKYLAASGLHGKPEVCLWEMPSRREVRRWQGHGWWAGMLTFSPDSSRLMSTGLGFESNPVAIEWDVATGKKLRTLTGIVYHLLGLSLSTDGKTFAMLDGSAGASNWGERSIRFQNAATGEDATPFPKHHGEISEIALAPHGNTLATASWDRTARLWNLETGKPLATLQGHDGVIHTLQYSPDGETIATGSRDKTVRLWQASTGKEIRKLLTTYENPGRHHSAEVETLAFSPDGRIVAAGEGSRNSDMGAAPDDGPVVLWDPATGKQLRTLNVKGGGRVHTVAFSPDGRLLASAGPDSWTIHLWNPLTGEKLPEIRDEEDPATPQTMQEGIAHIVFSPDGKTLASLSRYDYPSSRRADNPGDDPVRTLRLWNVATRTERFQIRLPPNILQSIAFSPDGKSLLAGQTDGSLSVWDLATNQKVRQFPGHNDRVSAIAFSRDGKTFTTGSWDTTALQWDAKLVNDR